MFRTYGKVLLAGSMLLLLLLVAACDKPGTGGTPLSSFNARTPTVVTAKSVRGDRGDGPIVVGLATPVAGGNAGSQQVVLSDRTLVINNVSKHNNANGSMSLVTLVLMIKNTSNNPIKNQASFFRLIGTEGDTFTYQSSSSANFYGDIAAHSSRNGTVVFQIPVAAAANLQLLYRPEVETETVLVVLKV